MKKRLSIISAITLTAMSLAYGTISAHASETLVPAEEYDTPIEGEGMLSGPSDSGESSSVFSSAAEPSVETIE